MGLNAWHNYTENPAFPEWRLFATTGSTSRQLVVRLPNYIPRGQISSSDWSVNCEPLALRHDFRADTLDAAQTEAVRLVTEHARWLAAWVENCLAAQPGYPALPPAPEPPPAPPLTVTERALWSALGYMRQAYGTLWAICDEENYPVEAGSAVNDVRRVDELLLRLVPLTPADTRVSTEDAS